MLINAEETSRELDDRSYSSLGSLTSLLYTAFLSERRAAVRTLCLKCAPSHAQGDPYATNKDAVALLCRRRRLYSVYRSVLHYLRTLQERLEDAAPM